MNVAVLCEFSGIVRDAFIRAGHNAISCDLLPSESDLGPHFQGDLREILDCDWDLIVAHPPCTYLCRASAPLWSSARWLWGWEEAVGLVHLIMNANCPRICVENPVGRLNHWYRYPDQTIQPWMFGHPTTKATCLWLKGLPLLTPGEVVKPTSNFIAGRGDLRWTGGEPGSQYKKNRWKHRSKTFPGVAQAMVLAWGGLV